MAKIRIYDLAKELHVSNQDVLDVLVSIGFSSKVPSSTIEDTTAKSVQQIIANKDKPIAPLEEELPAAPAPSFKTFNPQTYRAQHTETVTAEVTAEAIQDFREVPDEPLPQPGPPSRVIPPRSGRFQRGRDRNLRREYFIRRGEATLTETPSTESAQPQEGVLLLPAALTVAELAQKINRPPAELIRKLFTMNIIRAANQTIESDVASQLMQQYGVQVEVEHSRAEMHVDEQENQDEMEDVPPVVTVMGHVDHGKTSLLDMIRSSNVQRGEAGGITQRIGAYETEHDGHRIVFLDTPGHEAFTRMRARGAHVTDIAVLVVAADDGVMPQTREAIDHARAAKVPLIVAMNKMDRVEADPDRVKGQLAEVGLIPEDYGGETVVIPVSAKTGQGVQDLLDMLILVAEMLELKANPHGAGTGTVIEARQDAQKGPMATVLIHRGTLRVGDNIVVGDVHGRIRAMQDYKGDPLEEAGPKTPVSIIGLAAVPHASDTLKVVPTAREAREQATQFAEDARQGRFAGTERVSLQDLFTQIQKGSVQELAVVVKADVQGSVEALCQSLEKLAHEEVRVRIIARATGQVSESDVMLASASNAIIIAFSVGSDVAAASLAQREKIEIRSYDVIYDAINEVKSALEGMLAPQTIETWSGEAECRKVFSSAKAGSIAGCMVTKGKMVAGSKLRILRNGQQVFEGKLDSLFHVKQAVKEMVAGQECGISCHRFNDFHEGDLLESILLQEVRRTID